MVKDKVKKFRKKPVIVEAYKTNEELMIARDTKEIVENLK